MLLTILALLTAAYVCGSPDLRFRSGSNVSDMFGKLLNADKNEPEFTSKREKQTNEKHQSRLLKSSPVNRLKTNISDPLSTKLLKMEAKANAYEEILAQKHRAADMFPEESLLTSDESERLASRKWRLQAAVELVARVRSQLHPQLRSLKLLKAHEKLLNERQSFSYLSSPSNTSFNSNYMHSVQPSGHIMRGTMVHGARFFKSETWCRNECAVLKAGSMCASFLYIKNNGTCVFHIDIENPQQ